MSYELFGQAVAIVLCVCFFMGIVCFACELSWRAIRSVSAIRKIKRYLREITNEESAETPKEAK